MQAVVDASRQRLEGGLGQIDNLSVINERGVVVGRRGENILVAAGDRLLEAPRLVLNTGTRSFVPPIPGIDDVDFLDNTSLLEAP
ncbi:MAG: hypothetical protein R2706_08550 [Acidimicrobiales bacterium]